MGHLESLSVSLLCFWRTEQRNGFALIAAINAKIIVDGNYGVTREEFAHPDEAKIGQVRLSIRIANREIVKMLNVLSTIERHPEHAACDQGQCCLGKDSFAGECWAIQLTG